MRIIVCVKEVLDPSAVNNYVLAGKLVVGADGKTLQADAVPRLINGFDEQAMEAALRIRDAGIDCRITAVAIGGADPKTLLKHCAALGADEIVAIDAGGAELDGWVVARVLAAYAKSSGGADLVLCGRQASDDDQGVVPLLLAELADMPAVTLARLVEVTGGQIRVTRATPDGDEVVAGNLPAVVTVSNELGTPRFPTAKAKMAARKMTPIELRASDLVPADALVAGVQLRKQFVPQVQGNCQFIGGTPAEAAHALIGILRSERII
ncbi:MAG: electron transfer flavoprotein subunit beta/FixA family protein [Rhodocyclales bacterium]|nr:electron transfer flavoprotein subunit beta/FixA family protein [Rhodocyclales bacterium]